MERLTDIVYQIELHSADGIRQCFTNGINPNEKYKGESLIYELTSEYTRSPRFKECVKAFVDYGLELEDKPLLAVLLDDSTALTLYLKESPAAISKKYSIRCAYTPLFEVTLLHICAEFNHVACAEVLVSYGADVNAAGGIDEHGFGRQTPIFHTVNQNNNQSVDMLHFLLANNANTKIILPGLIWGKGYKWETFIPAITTASYAMMGLLPQMHRDEKIIADTVSLLLKHEFGIDYQSPNVPNKYLH